MSTPRAYSFKAEDLRCLVDFWGRITNGCSPFIRNVPTCKKMREDCDSMNTSKNDHLL